VSRAEHDERARFESLYRETRVPVLAYLMRRTVSPEDAADLLADVYLVAWRRIRDVPPGDEARLWLFGVARRVLSSHRRRARAATGLGVALAESLRLIAAELAADAEGADPRVERVASAMAALSRKDRELLTLSAWEGLTPAEIAVVVGQPAGVVRVRLHRARRRLREELLELSAEPVRSTPDPRARERPDLLGDLGIASD
jgi:RNA polymerase sigma factor (sigma-70 family)